MRKKGTLWKRGVAILLAATMIFDMVEMPVLAAENPEAVEVSEAATGNEETTGVSEPVTGDDEKAGTSEAVDATEAAAENDDTVEPAQGDDPAGTENADVPVADDAANGVTPEESGAEAAEATVDEAAITEENEPAGAEAAAEGMDGTAMADSTTDEASIDAVLAEADSAKDEEISEEVLEYEQASYDAADGDIISISVKDGEINFDRLMDMDDMLEVLRDTVTVTVADSLVEGGQRILDGSELKLGTEDGDTTGYSIFYIYSKSPEPYGKINYFDESFTTHAKKIISKKRRYVYIGVRHNNTGAYSDEVTLIVNYLNNDIIIEEDEFLPRLVLGGGELLTKSAIENGIAKALSQGNILQAWSGTEAVPRLGDIYASESVPTDVVINNTEHYRVELESVYQWIDSEDEEDEEEMFEYDLNELSTVPVGDNYMVDFRVSLYKGAACMRDTVYERELSVTWDVGMDVIEGDRLLRLESYNHWCNIPKGLTMDKFANAIKGKLTDRLVLYEKAGDYTRTVIGADQIKMAPDAGIAGTYYVMNVQTVSRDGFLWTASEEKKDWSEVDIFELVYDDDDDEDAECRYMCTYSVAEYSDSQPTGLVLSDTINVYVENAADGDLYFNPGTVSFENKSTLTLAALQEAISQKLVYLEKMVWNMDVDSSEWGVEINNPQSVWSTSAIPSAGTCYLLSDLVVKDGETVLNLSDVAAWKTGKYTLDYTVTEYTDGKVSSNKCHSDGLGTLSLGRKMILSVGGLENFEYDARTELNCNSANIVKLEGTGIDQELKLTDGTCTYKYLQDGEEKTGTFALELYKVEYEWDEDEEEYEYYVKVEGNATKEAGTYLIKVVNTSEDSYVDFETAKFVTIYSYTIGGDLLTFNFKNAENGLQYDSASGEFIYNGKRFIKDNIESVTVNKNSARYQAANEDLRCEIDALAEVFLQRVTPIKSKVWIGENYAKIRLKKISNFQNYFYFFYSVREGNPVGLSFFGGAPASEENGTVTAYGTVYVGDSNKKQFIPFTGSAVNMGGRNESIETITNIECIDSADKPTAFVSGSVTYGTDRYMSLGCQWITPEPGKSYDNRIRMTVQMRNYGVVTLILTVEKDPMLEFADEIPFKYKWGGRFEKELNTPVWEEDDDEEEYETYYIGYIGKALTTSGTTPDIQLTVNTGEAGGSCSVEEYAFYYKYGGAYRKAEKAEDIQTYAVLAKVKYVSKDGSEAYYTVARDFSIVEQTELCKGKAYVAEIGKDDVDFSIEALAACLTYGKYGAAVKAADIGEIVAFSADKEKPFRIDSVTNKKKVPIICSGIDEEDDDYEYTYEVTNIINLADGSNVAYEGQPYVVFCGTGSLAEWTFAVAFETAKKTGSGEDPSTGEDPGAGENKEPATYTIKYELDGGTNDATNPGSYKENLDADIVLKDPAKVGYTFVGWYSDDKLENKVTGISKGSTGEKTFYARWEVNTYTIKFDGNGAASVAMEALAATYGLEVTLPDNTFIRANYDFKEWNTAKDGNGTGYADKATVTESLATENGAEVVLYAQWTQKVGSYDIIYSLDGGTNSDENPTQYDEDWDPIILEEPTKTGYTFEGWYSDAARTKNKIDKIEPGIGTIYVFAKWKANTYTVTFDGNGADTGNMNPMSCTYDVRGELTDNKYKNTGSTFIGWNTEEDGSGTSYANRAGILNLTDENGDTVVLYAQWKENAFSITYILNGGMNHAENPSWYEADSGEIELKDPVREGYKFGGWYSVASFKKNKKVTKIAEDSKKEDKTFYAKWTAIKYNVKFEKNGSGVTGKMSNLKNKSYGKPFKLISNKYKRKGYTFVGWNTKADGSGTPYKNGASVKDLIAEEGETVSIYAQWTEVKYKITYNLKGGSKNLENPDIYMVTSDDIELKDPEKEGYIFQGWYKDAKYSKKKKITTIKKGSTGNLKLHAKWKKKK